MGHSTTAFIITVSSRATTVPASYSAQFEEVLRCDISSSFFKDNGQIDKQHLIYSVYQLQAKSLQGPGYLHRDKKTMLACMRVEYVVPLTGRIQRQRQDH
jgi:hypothetical protein